VSPVKVELVEEEIQQTTDDGIILGKRQRVKKKMYDDIITNIINYIIFTERYSIIINYITITERYSIIINYITIIERYSIIINYITITERYSIIINYITFTARYKYHKLHYNYCKIQIS
jgi:hypothetical protein